MRRAAAALLLALFALLPATAHAATTPVKLASPGAVYWNSTSGFSPTSWTVDWVNVPGSGGKYQGQQTSGSLGGVPAITLNSSNLGLSYFSSDSAAETTSCVIAAWAEYLLPFGVSTTQDAKPRAWYLDTSWDGGSFVWQGVDTLPSRYSACMFVGPWTSGISGSSSFNTSGGVFILNRGVTLRMLRVLNFVRTGASTWSVGIRDSAYLLQAGMWSSSSAETTLAANVTNVTVSMLLPKFYGVTVVAKNTSGVGNYNVVYQPSGTLSCGWACATSDADRAGLWSAETSKTITDWTGGAIDQADASGSDDSYTGTGKNWSAGNFGEVFSGVPDAANSIKGWFWPFDRIAGWN